MSGPNNDDDGEETRTSVTKLGVAVLARTGPEQAKPYLVVLMGANVGETFALDREQVLGRATTASIRFDDDGVSRKHARLSPSSTGTWMLEDLGSANGTLVNGERVTRCPLNDNDKIQLGPSTLLKFTFHDELEQDFQQRMYDAALRDGLTKAFNKKYFLTRLDTELAYARRHKANLSLVMIDVDHFKQINDSYGHPAGDAVLVTLTQIIQKTVRAEDVFARYGGEEFALICRGVSREQTCVLAERIRAHVEMTQFGTEKSRLPVTVSLGVATMPEFAAESSLQLIAAADEALYLAKRSGRNRVMRHGG